MIGGEKTTCPLAVDYFVSRVNPLFSDVIGGHIDLSYKSNQKISIREVVIEDIQKAPYTNAEPIIDFHKLQYSNLEHHWVDIYPKGLRSPNHRMERDSGHSLRRPGAPLLHLYLDPKYVTSITIPGVELQVVNIVTSERRADESEEESYSVTRSSDSDSLHVDEDLFNSGYFPKDTEEVFELESSQENANEVPSSFSSSSYDPVKDLYEILSNSKERLVVAHALKGTYREPSLNSWMESHVASINSSSRYSRVDHTSSSSSQDAPPLPARGPRSFQSPFIQPKDVAALQVPNLIANFPINTEDSTTIATNGQPQQSNTKVAIITERNCSRFFKWFQQFRKHFQNRRNIDAAKIVATTFLGLIAFGVITALSLGIK